MEAEASPLPRLISFFVIIFCASSSSVFLVLVLISRDFIVLRAFLRSSVLDALLDDDDDESLELSNDSLELSSVFLFSFPAGDSELRIFCITRDLSASGEDSECAGDLRVCLTGTCSREMSGHGFCKSLFLPESVLSFLS